MTASTTNAELRLDPTAIRRTVLDLLYRGSASHLGPCMSMIEILVAVYSCCDMERIQRREPDRDRVVVSKGHSAAAVYATLQHLGVLDPHDLEDYHQDGSLLAGHVSHAVDGVEHSTGALGHGLSVACGCALGLRADGDARPAWVYAITGDGELQEGSIWEALMFAHHHQLKMIVVVDNNRISSITDTHRVIDLNPLRQRFEGFGLPTCEVDGHDVGQLRTALDDAGNRNGPSVVIAHTIKGRGVPFAEQEPVWHYRPLSKETYAQAIEALES